MLAQRSDVEKRTTMCALPLSKCAHSSSTPTPTKYSGQSSVHILLQPRAFSVLIPPLYEALFPGFQNPIPLLTSSCASSLPQPVNFGTSRVLSSNFMALNPISNSDSPQVAIHSLYLLAISTSKLPGMFF